MLKALSMAAVAAIAINGLGAKPTHAAGAANRAWVSGRGTDNAGCGAPTAPCRSFQYVVNNIIAPGGEIDVLDPAGYGAVTITHALSIVNDGVGTAGVQQGTTGQNAITISAGPNDSVTLRGLNIDGLGSGQNGIVFNSGASLTVSNCVIRHFAFGGSSATGNGILIRPGSGPMSFLISDVTVTDNGYVGVYFTPTGGTPSIHGVIEHVVAVNDQFGFALDSTPATGGAMAVAITNGVASNNSADGLYIAGTAAAPLIISINDSTISGNGNYGLLALNSATVLLSRNMIMSNVNIGIDNAVAPNNFFTYGDNVINGNGTDIAPQALNSSLKLQ